MNIQRLRTLRNALRRVAKNPGNFRFDLENWATIPTEYIGETWLTVASKALKGQNYCGTAGCAMGIAMVLPSFRKQGLRTVWGNTPCFNGDTGFTAAREFFELTSPAEAEWLFNPKYYAREELHDPLAVAARIDQMLEQAKPPKKGGRS